MRQCPVGASRAHTHTEDFVRERGWRTYLWLAKGTNEESLEDVTGLVGMAYVLEGFGRVLSCYRNVNTRVKGTIGRKWTAKERSASCELSILTSFCKYDFFTTRMLNCGMSI